MKNQTLKTSQKISQKSILEFLESLQPQLQKEGIEALGLFGSFAKGSADNASDIDIFIKSSHIFCKKYVGFKAFIFLDTLRADLARHFKREVDLCDIASLNDKKLARLLDKAIWVYNTSNNNHKKVHNG